MRHFKTNKAKRSKTYRQLVLPTPSGYIREIAIRYKHSRSRRRAKFWTRDVRPQMVIPVILVVIGLSGTTYFGLLIAKGHKLEPTRTFGSSTQVRATAIQPLPRSLPTHITIPSVGIDASVMSVGRDASGSIQMPPLFDWTTGWYKDSPTPGQEGPSIIVGHVDTYKGISVFWRLRDIQRGDIIQIARADGRTVKFKVVALKQFSQSDFPTKEVYGNLQYPGLRLITCGGAFNQQTSQYTQNTVVFASMVTQS